MIIFMHLCYNNYTILMINNNNNNNNNNNGEKYYLHKPEPVVSIDDITLTWDQGVLIDRTIPASRPDIIFLDRKENYCLLIEISISRRPKCYEKN